MKNFTVTFRPAPYEQCVAQFKAVYNGLEFVGIIAQGKYGKYATTLDLDFRCFPPREKNEVLNSILCSFIGIYTDSTIKLL